MDDYPPRQTSSLESTEGGAPRYRYLIIGNSAGGIGAAEAIRRVDELGSIAIISDEPHRAYSRALIPYYLSGRVSVENVFYKPPDFYREKGVHAILGRRVARLDFDGRAALLENGERIFYEKLLIAAGGRPLIPNIPGLEKDGVSTFTALQDAVNLRKRIDAGTLEKAVVLGGGLIGLFVAEALSLLGVDVIVVELADRILSPVLDPAASSIMENVLRRNGIRIVTGRTIREILGREDRENAVGGVVLDNGERLPCDAVVVAIGVAPRTDLVRDSAVRINRGIVVDKHMETSIRGVFACGDCAEAYDFAFETSRLTPLWPTAYVGGMVAGYNMAGLEREYNWGTGMNSIEFFGLPVISAGIVSPAEGDGYEALTRLDEERGVYRKIVLKGSRVVGMILLNQVDRAGVILGLMRNKTDVSGFKDALLSEDFGLVYLPGDLRREMLVEGAWSR